MIVKTKTIEQPVTISGKADISKFLKADTSAIQRLQKRGIKLSGIKKVKRYVQMTSFGKQKKVRKTTYELTLSDNNRNFLHFSKQM